VNYFEEQVRYHSLDIDDSADNFGLIESAYFKISEVQSIADTLDN
jgi:hypothetical protein